jgi:hypothetical protein
VKQRTEDHKKSIACAVRDAFSAAGALRMLGLKIAGGNYETLYNHIRKYSVRDAWLDEVTATVRSWGSTV